MNQMIFLVPVFIDEFQVLHDSGSIRVDRSRVVIASSEGDGLSRPEVRLQVQAALPEFMNDAEHSVVILCFSGTAPRASGPGGAQLGFGVHFRSMDCNRVIPLTARAREILAGRLGGRTKLDVPVFEKAVSEHLSEREVRNSVAGAKSLVEVLVANPERFHIEDLTVSMADDSDGHSDFIGRVLQYTRYDNMPAEPISGLRDLGSLLKGGRSEAGALPPLLTRLGHWIKHRKDSTRGFKQVFGDSELAGILADITTEWQLSASAAGLVIFLHWRELSLKHQGLDLKALETDCRELAAFVDGSHVMEALWLLGFSAGFESFSVSYYSALEAPHPFGARHKPLQRIQLLSIEPPPVKAEADMTVPPADQEKAKIESPDLIASPSEETAAVQSAEGSGDRFGEPPGGGIDAIGQPADEGRILESEALVSLDSTASTSVDVAGGKRRTAKKSPSKAEGQKPRSMKKEGSPKENSKPQAAEDTMLPLVGESVGKPPEGGKDET